MVVCPLEPVMFTFALYMLLGITVYLVVEHHATNSRTLEVFTPRVDQKGITMLAILAEPNPGSDQVAVSFEVISGQIEQEFTWLLAESLESYEINLLGCVLSPVWTKPVMQKGQVSETLSVVLEIKHDTLETVEHILETVIDEIKGLGRDSCLRFLGTEQRRGAFDQCLS